MNSQQHTSADTAQQLQLVEARIEFFGSARLRPFYTSLLRELAHERQALRARMEREWNAGNGTVTA